MDVGPSERLAQRLAKLGMPMQGDVLARAEALLGRYGYSPEHLSDLWLMTLCVEAYRRPDADLPAWA